MADLPAPKPFYRSRLFWLGLPALVFLVWLSVGCPPWMLAIERYDRAYGLVVGVDDGFRFVSMEAKGGGFSNRVAFESAKNMEPIPAGRPIRFTRAGSNKAFGLRRIDGVVSYPAVTLFYTGLWLAALASWQRRKARLWEASAALPP